MSRQNRPNIPGAIYHVMNRGNRKAAIFDDDRDRRTFLRTLIEEQEVYGVKTLGGSLMNNHFHLAILTPHPNLSEFMKQLQGRFARYTNRRHERVGHLFQGRFRHVLIENDIHLLTALCYIFMNPVTAGLVENIEDHRWSSYAATAGFAPLPAYLSIDWLDTFFPDLSRSEAQLSLRQIMATPKPIATYIRNTELNVHPDIIKNVIRSFTGDQFDLASLPRTYRTALRPPLKDLLLEAGSDRVGFIKKARVTFGYRNAEIAKVLKLKPATISKIYCASRPVPR